MNEQAAPGFLHVIPNVGKFERCPKAWLRDEAGAVQQLISDSAWLRQHGVMPRKGGLLSQDPRFIEAHGLINEEIFAVAKRRREQDERRREEAAKRKGRPKRGA